MTTAALALVAFASCSSDDFFSTDSAQKKDFTSVLEVTVEEPDFGEVTRAARKGDATGFKWQADDQIRVYDTDLGKYDVYEYADAFGREGATVLEKDPAYALFPAENVKRGYWDPTDGHVAEIVIPKVITYSKTNGAETKLDDGTVLYKMFTPMQGKVEKVDDATVRVLEPGMQVMSGVLYMTLNQALGNASYIKLSSASTNLSGRFLAKLDEENPSLIESSDELIAASYSKDLYIDLRNLPSDKAVLYVPVIAGVNDLKVSRTTSTADDPTTIVPAQWTLITNLDTYTFQRNRFKSVEFTYTLAANTPSGINTALAQYNEQPTAVTLDVTKSLTIADADKTIEIPAMAAEKVTINLLNTTAVTNSTPSTLIIKNADDAKPFTGTLVLNVGENLADGSKLPLEINLPSAKVVLVGDYTKSNVATLTLTAVDELQFGDGSTTTKFSGATLNWDGVATKMTVEKNATVSASTSLTAKDAALEVKGGTIAGTIDGSGTVTIASATIAGSVSADLVLSGDLSISGSVGGNITTKGNVEVARTSEGAAIAADKTLTFKRAKTLTMKQGYIGIVATDFSELGEADPKNVSIKFEENGLTAIKTVTYPSAPASIAFSNKSTWTGVLPTAATISSFLNTTSKEINTAAQLVSFMGATSAVDIVIKNDIDLNNDPNRKWTAPIGNSSTAVAVTIDGKEHTISNINLNNLVYNVQGIGFIGSADALTVSNLTLDNVQFTKTYDTRNAGSISSSFMVKAVGGLCGTASGGISLSNVTVNLADNFGYSSYSVHNSVAVEVDATKVGIGGLIGIAGGDADLNNVDVTGDKIQGYTSLGGFIGVTTGDIDIDNDCSSNITAFQVNYNDPAASNIEMNLARIGGAVGYVAAAKNVTVAYGATTNNVSVASTSNYDTAKLYISVPTAGGAKLYNYAAGQQWIGFSATEAVPTTDLGTVKIAKTSSANYIFLTPTFNATTGAIETVDASNDNKQPLYIWTSKAN